jgi:hypothetical protein
MTLQHCSGPAPVICLRRYADRQFCPPTNRGTVLSRCSTPRALKCPHNLRFIRSPPCLRAKRTLPCAYRGKRAVSAHPANAEPNADARASDCAPARGIGCGRRHRCACACPRHRRRLTSMTLIGSQPHRYRPGPSTRSSSSRHARSQLIWLRHTSKVVRTWAGGSLTRLCSLRRRTWTRS